MEANIVAGDKTEVQTPIAGRVLNISKEGLCLRTSFKAAVSALISLSVDCWEHDSLCLAEIVWQAEEPQGYLYGLRIRRWSYLDSFLENEINMRGIPTSA